LQALFEGTGQVSTINMRFLLSRQVVGGSRFPLTIVLNWPAVLKKCRYNTSEPCRSLPDRAVRLRDKIFAA
jgi:hypothetical protein